MLGGRSQKTCGISTTVRSEKPLQRLGTKSAVVNVLVNERKEIVMFNWAVTFLIIAIIAALFGFSGIAGTATNIAWILFVVGLILSLIFFLTGRGGRGV